jgi:hypothetical protein
VWISAHDGDKEVKGLATKFLETKKWAADELTRHLAEDKEDRNKSPAAAAERARLWKGTKVLSLEIGEAVMLDHEGILKGTDTDQADQQAALVRGPQTVGAIPR